MSCHEFELMMADALGGELTGKDRTKFEAHVAGCSDCRRQYETLRGTLAELQSLNDVPMYGASVARSRPVSIPTSPSRGHVLRFGPNWLRYAASILVAFASGYGLHVLQARPDSPEVASVPPLLREDPTLRPPVWRQGFANESLADASFGSAVVRARLAQPNRSDFAACMVAMFDGKR